MNGNNNQNGLIVNPLKTEKMVGSANIAVPNTVESFGTHTQIAEDVQKIGMNWQRIRDFQDKTLGMNFLASIKDELSKFQVDLASKKETYQSDEQINALKQRYREKVEMYKKIASEQGYDSEYVDAYISRANQELQGAENNFLVKNLKYQEEVAIDNYNQGLLIQEQTNERYMVSGNYAQGISGFLETVGYLNDGVKSGYIDRAKVPIMIKQGWNGMLKAHGESLINTPNGASQIEQMLNWNFNQFASYFSKLDTKAGDNEFKLGSDEFEVWKSGLRSAYASLKSGQKAEKGMTWIKEQELREEFVKNPYKAFARINNWEAGHRITEADIVGTNNRMYGVNFKTIKEFNDKGYTVKYPDIEITGFDSYYKDPNISSEAMMLKSYETANRMVGGLSKEIQEEYFDNTNKGLTFGSLGTKAYFTDPNVKMMTDELYTPENRQIIASFNNEIQDTSITNMKQYNEPSVFDTEIEYDPATDVYLPKKRTDTVSLAVGAKFNAISSNALKGDTQALRAKEDILRMRLDSVKVALFKDTNGVITEDLADEAGLKDKYVGQPIIAQDKSTQQKIYDSYLRSNKELNDEIDMKTEILINSATSEFTPINLGTRGAVYVGKNIKEDKASKTVDQFIKNKKFYIYTTDEKGEQKKLEVPNSQITISNRMGDNKLWLEYNGRNLFDEQGKPQFVEVFE